jgi:HEAT repeat protein
MMSISGRVTRTTFHPMSGERVTAVWIRNLSWALVVVAFSGLPAARVWALDGPAGSPTDPAIEKLKAENTDVRRDAANKVRLADKSVQRQALPVLIDRLANDKDGQVRLAVLDTLISLGPDAAPAVPALLETLRTDVGGRGEEASHQDYRSAMALAGIGKPSVEGLISLLTHKKESVRAEVVMSLGRIGPDAALAVAELIPLLADKNERIGREAVVALGRIGLPAIDPLIAASTDADVLMRRRAVESLGHLFAPNENAKQAALKSAADAAPPVRAAAVKALAGLGLADDILVPIVKENLRHGDEDVRLAVVNLLVMRRPLLRRMAPDLQSLLTAKEDGVARHAGYLLGKSGPDAAPLLLTSLHEKTSRVEEIAGALAQIGRPIVDALAQALKDPDPRLRRGAALALGQIRPLPAGIAQKLTVGLGDPDREVKGAFLIAIGNLGPRARESVPAVRALLQDSSADVRGKAIEILAQSAPRDDRLASDLIARVNDADRGVQRRAIDALRSLGPLGNRALPDVIAKLDSKQLEVRLAAALMIGSHGQAAAAAVPALAALLDDPSPELRMIVAQTLGQMGKAAQPAFAKLSALINAEQLEVREAAALTLGSLDLDAEKVRPALAIALRDGKTEVRRAAMKSIQRFGPQGAIFVPDIIMLAEKKENLRSVERMLRRFERAGPDVRSLPELVKQLDHNQDNVRLLAIKFLGLAGPNAKDAIPALERMREDPSAEVRKQAQAASERIMNNSGSSQEKGNARKTAATG